MTESNSTRRSTGQQQALAQLRRVAAVNNAMRIVAVREPVKAGGYLHVDVSISCAGLRRTSMGLQLRQRELLTLLVPAQFPLSLPHVWTRHRRFAGAPHVQWGRSVCLYRSPSVEWDPADGIYGFIGRLITWFERAAVGELDAPGQPLHPPVAYSSAAAGLLVVRADAPTRPAGRCWLGVALVRRVDGRRGDVVGWLDLGDTWPETPQQAREAAGVIDDAATVFLAPAVIATEPIAFEYPDTARELLDALAGDAVSADVLLGLLGFAARHNERLTTADESHDIVKNPTVDSDATGHEYVSGTEESAVAPLYLIVGDPSRGTAGSDDRRTHLSAWRLSGLGRQIAELVPMRYSDDAELAKLGNRVAEIGKQWLEAASVEWAIVDEARPEIVVRRDANTSAQWLYGKRVLVLGAGALGAPVAEMCVRGGASHVVVVDRRAVRHGVLVRQPYSDADIGEPKATVLAQRLRHIRPDAKIEAVVGDVCSSELPGDGAAFDLIIDATADRIVRTHLERTRRAYRDRWPTLATLLVGHNATRGIAAIAGARASGGGADVLRRAGIAARTEATGELRDFADDFFPTEMRTDLFQPEPGCSDATFVGSAAAVTSLTGQLFTGVLAAVSQPDEQQTMSVLFVRLPGGPRDPCPRGTRWISWPNDIVFDDLTGFEVRISARAAAELRAEACRGVRIRGPRVETGGTLLGAFDDAAGVVWIDEATGPPPDSLLSEVHFQHGIAGVDQQLSARREATGKATRFVGMWHTHPYGPAWPSPTDEAGMAALVMPARTAPPRALILIAGGPAEQWTAWLEGYGTPAWYARIVDRTDSDANAQPQLCDVDRHGGPVTWWPGGFATRPLAIPASDLRSYAGPAALGTAALEETDVLSRDIGLALSGGGFRAAAFHLGCLRALHDLRLLNRVRVVSGISGGSLMAALWGYGLADFSEFDRSAVKLLRRGLQHSIAWRALRPSRLTRAAVSAGSALLRPGRPAATRKATRTDCLADALRELAFGDTTMTEAVRVGTDIVLTATDLITGTAVRFGSATSSSSKHGAITEPVEVANAVAASAAFPLLLPAVEQEPLFTRATSRTHHPLLLADGGLYDNLGLTVLQPGRSAHYTHHIYNINYIVSCDAGRGLLQKKAPHFLPGRLKRTVEIIHERAQNEGRGKLHEWAAAGLLDGFTMAYLGMRDERIPVPVADLVPHERVATYPTNFAAMSTRDLDALTLRGEQLIRALLPIYCPRLT